MIKKGNIRKTFTFSKASLEYFEFFLGKLNSARLISILTTAVENDIHSICNQERNDNNEKR